MVVQCLITHLVVGRRIAMLDQFASGLQTLGFLSAIRTESAVFEELFVSTSKLTPDAVKSLIRLKPGTSGSDAAMAVLANIHAIVEESDEEGKYHVCS